MSDFEYMKGMLPPDAIKIDEDVKCLKMEKDIPSYCHTLKVRNMGALGYADFFSVWLFDENGKFLAVGHYE